MQGAWVQSLGSHMLQLRPGTVKLINIKKKKKHRLRECSLWQHADQKSLFADSLKLGGQLDPQMENMPP